MQTYTFGTCCEVNQLCTLRTFFIGALALASLALTFNAHAQYKWVGPDGKVTYSDQPPPTGAKQVEQKNLSTGNSSAPDTSSLPFEVKRAAQNFPVILYSSKDCKPCEEGRGHLTKRGIPFSEKNVSSARDFEAFKQVSSTNQFPVLTVGSQKSVGFQADSWNSLLDAAGYPKNSTLPRTYKNPEASNLAGAESKADAKASNTANSNATNSENGQVNGQPPRRLRPAPAPAAEQPSNVPPGFRF